MSVIEVLLNWVKFGAHHKPSKMSWIEQTKLNAKNNNIFNAKYFIIGEEHMSVT